MSNQSQMGDKPTDETDRQIDGEKAEEVAREALARELAGPEETTRSDVAWLVDRLIKVRVSLENGNEPSKSDIEEARACLRLVKGHLDDVTQLFGWNPWDTGARWDELSEEQKEEIRERDRRRIE